MKGEREGGREGRERGGERGGRERGERGGEREGERGGEGGRGGEREGERGGERENLFLLTTFFDPYNLIMGEFFSSSLLPQLQDRGSLLFLIMYMKKLLSSDWLR